MSAAFLHEILVADDDSGIRDMLARALKADFRVHTAKDGTEAVALLEKLRPAAVLVDEMMPGVPGTQVLERAKALHPDVPRLLMTASQDSARAMDAINRGEIHRFYTKPLKIMDVRRALLELVARADAERSLRVELRTLRELRESAQTGRVGATRVVVLGPSAERAERVGAACNARGFEVTRVTRLEEMPPALMAQPADVVVLLCDPAIDVAALAKLAHTIDEATAVVLVDDEPRLTEAMSALAVGAVDYIAKPYPDGAALAARIDRAAQKPRAQRDLRRLTFDLVIANRELARERRRVETEQVKLVNAMIRALEARDSYTAGHTDRVATISVRCGEVLGFDSTRIEIVRMGALLHDVGKIGIRDDVLLKPGRLTPEEFEIIKTHTIIGAQVLGDIEQFQCILPVVRNHHERLDGSGYPDGLKGDAIPQEVRVVSASDALDALTSTRPYRRGSKVEEAFDILAGSIGRHLDAQVIDALKQVHTQGRLVELLQPDADKGELPGPYREP